MSALDKYKAILHTRWEKGKDKDSIIGFWAEDFSSYEIKIPSQLRDILIELQNSLCNKCAEIDKLKSKLYSIEKDVSNILEKDNYGL